MSKGKPLNIGRRDFMNGTLLGTGALLLSAAAPIGLFPPARASGLPKTDQPEFGPSWTGPRGIGEYSAAVGDSEAMPKGHRVRDEEYPDASSAEVEEFDYIVVGCGFSGAGAAYQLKKQTDGQANILVIDPHPLPGGVAKANEFEVDGYRLKAPQASDNFMKPNFIGKMFFYDEIWEELEMPSADELDHLLLKKEMVGVDSSLKFAPGHYEAKYFQPEQATCGYYFRNKKTGKYDMAIDCIEKQWKNAPFPEKLQQQFANLHDQYQPLAYTDENGEWLLWSDHVSFKDYILNYLNYDQEVVNYLNPLIASAGGGLGCDAITFLHAQNHGVPGTMNYVLDYQPAYLTWLGKLFQLQKHLLNFSAFPGGNSLIHRKIVKSLLPEAIPGDDSLANVFNTEYDKSQFDRDGNSIRLRMNAIATEIEHLSDDEVMVSYLKDGKPMRAKAKGVVLGCGGWIGKRILKDIPDKLFKAFDSYTHAPMITVNVAVRNWQFMANLGITAAHWWDGWGHFVNLTHPVELGDYDEPNDPSKPAILTMYVSLEQPGSGLDAKDQATLARSELLDMSYADIEKKTLHKLSELFEAGGFDAERDVAEIIVNRWGHDFVVAGPGFYFGGKDGSPAPRDIIREGYGNITIGHSELNGAQTWASAVSEGRRAADQLLERAKA